MVEGWQYLGSNSIKDDLRLRMPPGVFDVTEMPEEAVYVVFNEETEYLEVSLESRTRRIIRSEETNINEKRLDFKDDFNSDFDVPEELAIEPDSERHFVRTSRAADSDTVICCILTREQLEEVTPDHWVPSLENYQRIFDAGVGEIIWDESESIRRGELSAGVFDDLTPGEFPGKDVVLIPFDGSSPVFMDHVQDIADHGNVLSPAAFNDGVESYNDYVGEEQEDVTHYPGVGLAEITVWWDPPATTYSDIDNWKMRSGGIETPEIKKKGYKIAENDTSQAWGVTLPSHGAYYIEVKAGDGVRTFRGETWLAHFSQLQDADDPYSRARSGTEIADWNAMYAMEVLDMILLFIPCIPWTADYEFNVLWMWDYVHPIGVYSTAN